MTEVIYRFDPPGCRRPEPPNSAAEANALLVEGNRLFVELFEEQQIVHVAPEAVGINPGGGAIPHRPFAAILGCADARVPIEFLFRCPSNALFVVRVAGNVAGTACVGSLEYAVTNLSESLRVIIVLGHSGCGAVTAAVDAYLDPQPSPPHPTPLQSIVDRIDPAVRLSATALAEVRGVPTTGNPDDREALIDVSVTVNAALTASSIGSTLSFPTRYAVYDMVSHEINLAEPPADPGAMKVLAAEVATIKCSQQPLG